MKDKNQEKTNILKRIFKTKKRIAVAVVIIVAIGFWYMQVSKKNGDFKVDEIKKGTVKEELILSGGVAAEEHANLSFLSSGEINHVAVVEGQYVEKDEVLVKLDSVSAYQTFLSAQDDLRKYQAALDNVYDQLQGHENDESYTQIETRTTAETNKDKAYRAYVIAEKSLSNLSLKAPFEGFVTSITHPYTGVNTTYTETQIEIVNPKSIYFEVSADQAEVTDLWLGQKVTIVLDSFSDEEIEGEVAYVGYTPRSDDVGISYKVKVKILSDFDRSKTRIGMSGDAKFLISEKKDALYIPSSFINSDTTGTYVNLARNNNKKYIEIGTEGEDRIEIIGDIKEGDKIFD
jgi:RND family efflux transporter MFP subunit